MVRFRDLANGQEFDFVDDAAPGYNSFFDRVRKVSARMYVSLRHPEYRYRVGSINAQVFHVGGVNA